ncbi:uncharacterized protein F5147DRAFT_831815 [Suillus discolor]|uniref:F-box domain-containing protein n=1 Tax=Suillus discolor TaxID=1912936 RepID=A0A9P7K0V7_9AGAM|nr:uncharacterized protein F5147DRAFT_831815 [Suillus discolor]KAG2120531.1 hypothetical protein F5147DRAFT_831815 [Suillus discolor]
MHQALLVPEILLEIFAYVNTKPSTSTQKLLAALARTCKIFHEPAMDLLWTEIHGGTRLQSDERIFWAKGVKPLSAHEARQFLRHSSRIRTLNIRGAHSHLLSIIPAEACVFPRLRSLSLSTAYLNLFLPHTFHQCHLLTVDEGLKSFVTRCIALEHLYIYTDFFYNSTSQRSLLSDRIRWCTRLVTLSCPTLDLATWKHLSCLPTLLKLEIDQSRWYGDPPSPSEQDIMNISPFLNITTLSFGRLFYVVDIIMVMQHSQFPSLKEFRFEADHLSSEEAEELFHALSRCKACRTLEEIIICSPDDCGLAPINNEPLKSIPHFLCFTQLRTLRLMFCNPYIYLDNDILLQAMSSWPHIRTLEINYLDGHLSSSEVSLHGLFTALSLCPQLHTLRIPINIPNIDVYPDAEPIQHTSLRTLELLDISQSQIEDAETLARIISAWLPCVDEVESMDGSWDEVNKHLKSSTAATALYVAGAS